MARDANVRPAQQAALRRIRDVISKPPPEPAQPVTPPPMPRPARIRTKQLKLHVYTHDRGGFHRLTGRNVLLYWHHGFGDWVQFSLVLPFLNHTNKYWITRWGDDTVTLLDKQSLVRPICLGMNGCCEDGGTGLRHFGIDFDRVDGGEVDLTVPASLHDVIRREHIDTVLCGEYPEPCGRSAVPFHTKPRNMIECLTRRNPAEFGQPLRRTLSLDEDPLLINIVQSKLTNFCGFGDRKLCLVAHRGQTSVYKNWGNLWREDLPPGRQASGQECIEFMKCMLHKDPNWMFLLMEERAFADSIKSPDYNCFAYCDVFGEPETGWAPFGRVMKCLARLASLCVGVPTGPYHLAAQVEELPTIGIWIDHLPSWYDEPRDGLIHVIGQQAAERLGCLPGSFLNEGAFSYRSIVLESRIIPGEAVFAAAEQVLALPSMISEKPTTSNPSPKFRRLRSLVKSLFR